MNEQQQSELEELEKKLKRYYDSLIKASPETIAEVLDLHEQKCSTGNIYRFIKKVQGGDDFKEALVSFYVNEEGKVDA